MSSNDVTLFSFLGNDVNAPSDFLYFIIFMVQVNNPSCSSASTLNGVASILGRLISHAVPGRRHESIQVPQFRSKAGMLCAQQHPRLSIFIISSCPCDHDAYALVTYNDDLSH